MTHGRYLVSGPFGFMDYQPGQEFEARLDPLKESRALQRGAIRLLERTTPSLQPGSYVLPFGWLTPRDADMASDHRKEQ